MDDYMKDDNVVIIVNDGNNNTSDDSNSDYKGGLVDLDRRLNEYYDKKQNGLNQTFEFNEDDAELFQQAQVNTMKKNMIIIKRIKMLILLTMYRGRMIVMMDMTRNMMIMYHGTRILLQIHRRDGLLLYCHR
jgi:hypothetical protein